MKRLALLLALVPALSFADLSDNFDRTNEALDADAAWTKLGGTGGTELSIVSNQLENSNAAGARRAYESTDQSSADMTVSSDFVGAVADMLGKTTNQVVGRLVDVDNYIGIGVGPIGQVNCGSRVAGTWTEFETTTQASVQAIKLELEGTNVRCYYDIGAGWVLFHTELSVTDHSTETSAGYVANQNNPGVAVWDNYSNTTIAGSGFTDQVQAVRDHFNTDHTLGTTYYFNNTATGTDNGTSDANAFTTCAQVDAKSFTAGDNLLFHEDQATTCTVKIKNDTMVGNGTTNHFHIGAYHMDGGVETPGLSGGPYSNTPGGRYCLDGGDWADYDYFGGMTNTQVQALEPPVTGNPMTVGVLEGLLNWYQSSDYDLDLHIEDMCVRSTGGRGIRFTQTGSAQADYLHVDNIYIQGTMTQALHLSGVNNFIVENSYFTQSDAEHRYGTSAGNTQACVAFKGTNNDPDTRVYGAFIANTIWDSYCSEGVQSNSGGKSILIDDNIIIDAGHVAGIYYDRTYDMTSRNNIVIHTGRTAFEMPSGALDWGAFVVQNEESCGSFDWCSTYNTPADFALYAVQRVVIENNICVGWRYCYTYQSQASGSSGNTHTGEAHGAGVYFYNNLSLDPDDRHFSINNAAPTSNYALRTDVPPRVWGNIFVNLGEIGNVLVERNDTQFATVFDYNYISNDLSVGSAYDQNITRTGIQFPLSDYTDLSSYMTTDADDWMDYDNVRAFVTTLGVNPDDLTSKDLVLFKPTVNVESGLALSAFTYPSGNLTGEPNGKDAEHNDRSSTPYFGPFATLLQDELTARPVRAQNLGDGFGPHPSQDLSGGLVH